MAEPADVIHISRPVTRTINQVFELDVPVGEISGSLETIDIEGTSRTCIVISVRSNSEASIDALVHTLDLVGQQFQSRVEEVGRESIKRIVEVLVPAKPVSSTKLLQAKMLMKAKTAVLESGDWVTASEIADLAQLSASNPSSQPSKWKREKRIFAITHNGTDYFPLYGLDETRGYRPLSQLKDVIMVLESAKDAWQMAYWFMSNNSWLASKRPQDLLRSDPDRVLEAAREEVAEISHG